MPNPRAASLTIRFTPESARYLTEFARKRGLSRSHLIRLAVKEKIERTIDEEKEYADFLAAKGQTPATGVDADGPMPDLAATTGPDED